MGRPTADNWPWYRPASVQSNDYRVTCAEAARAARVVLEQMKEYAEDEQGRAAIQEIQDRMEVQARDWLQRPLELSQPELSAGMRCKTVKKSWLPAGTPVIITSVCKTTRTCWAYQDKPATHRTNARGRKVVASDPKNIQSCYCWHELQPTN